MKKIFGMSVVVGLVVALSVPAFALTSEGIFLEYNKFSSSEPSWAGTLGAKFEIIGHKDFSLVFNGRIETVSEKANPIGGAGLTDIDYRLEPRIYFKNYYLSFNHWSLHKADVPGGVPNLNVVTFGLERSFGRLSLVGGAQYRMTNSDADYNKALFIDAIYFFRENKNRYYVREIAEALPGIISKTEAGYRFPVRSGKLMKSYDLFAGWQYGKEDRVISSQYGLAATGVFGGFRFNF